MAPRAYWKGYLKRSLASCPTTLLPATSEREKISFHLSRKSTESVQNCSLGLAIPNNSS
jgi:DNA end-binding protein Ku